MQAVILAGGRGVRLGPLTEREPKPMVRVGGAPYLEHQLRLLGRQSIRNIVLLTGYLGEQISAYFGDGARWGLSIRYSREEQPLGTGGALRLAYDLLQEDFLVIYGDSYLPIAYADPLDQLRASGCRGLVVVYDNRLDDTSVPNNIAIDRCGRVCRYLKTARPDPQLTHVDAGVLAFRREAIGEIPPGTAVSLENELFPCLIADRQLLAFATRQRFYDIGTPDRLRVFEGLLAQ